MRKLLKYAKRYCVQLLLVILLCIFSVCLTVFGTSYLRDLTNYINEAANGAGLNLGTVAQLCGTLIGMYVGAAILHFLQSYLLTGITQGISKKLRQDLANKTNRLPISYFDTHKTGDTLSRITNDIDTVAQSLQSAVNATASAVVQIILLFFVLFFSKLQMKFNSFFSLSFSFFFIISVDKNFQKYF